MADNFSQIKTLLVFETTDDFYHLQILKRKKEHPSMGSNSYVVKTYYISSLEYLEDKLSEIKALCDHHNARACINLNRRSFEKIAFQVLRKVADQIMNKDYKSARKAYESVCGAYPNEPNKKWVVDIDSFDQNLISSVVLAIEQIPPFSLDESRYLATLSTKNGVHLICTPFDMRHFKAKFPEIDVHRDNPTILYIP